MSKKSTSIDFEIIWKSIHDDIQENEKIILEQWLEENPKHREYYDKVISYYQNKEHELANADITKLWSDISDQQKIYNLPRYTSHKDKSRWLYVAASLIFLVVATYFISENYSTVSQEQELAVNADNSTIDHGERKATLHIGRDKMIEIGSKQAFNQKYTNPLVKINEESITYLNNNDSDNIQIETHRIDVPKGAEFKLILSDGTKVWMNSESTLTYPSGFSGDNRQVELTGEAYFEVTHNEDMPFEVITGNQTITVLGTSFNVSNYPDDEKIVSTLIEGKVKVNSDKASEITLVPGEQSILIPSKDEITKREVNVRHYTAWKEGLFYFGNESLEEIMTVLSRWYDIEVKFINPELKNIKFQGTLKRYENFENAIEPIKMTEDVHFKIEGRKILIE